MDPTYKTYKCHWPKRCLGGLHAIPDFIGVVYLGASEHTNTPDRGPGFPGFGATFNVVFVGQVYPREHDESGDTQYKQHLRMYPNNCGPERVTQSVSVMQARPVKRDDLRFRSMEHHLLRGISRSATHDCVMLEKEASSSATPMSRMQLEQQFPGLVGIVGFGRDRQAKVAFRVARRISVASRSEDRTRYFKYLGLDCWSCVDTRGSCQKCCITSINRGFLVPHMYVDWETKTSTFFDLICERERCCLPLFNSSQATVSKSCC